MNGAAWSSLKAFSFEQVRTKFTKCLEPTMSCPLDAIKAHSIQNAKILDLLQHSGHVVVPRQAMTPHGPSVELKLVGRNNATTFTGLCSVHDTSIFKPIEVGEVDVTNSEHLFLLAYRAVVKELHTVMEWAYRLQPVYQKRVELGLSPKNEPDDAGWFATERLMASYETWLYKSQYDQALLSRDFSAVSHEVIELAVQSPTIAVNSLTCDTEIRTDDDVARVALNVFPRQDNVVAVFSYLTKEKQHARAFHDQISQSSGDYQKYLLSRLILRCCENFVLSPAYYDTMSPERKAAIQHFFMTTVLKNDTGVHDPNLFLF